MPRDLLIQVRRDTTANWATRNPILASGEPGYDEDLQLLKIGNGLTHWVDLPGLSTALADVAFSGDYADLSNTPTIPTTPGAVGADPAGTAASLSSAAREAAIAAAASDAAAKAATARDDAEAYTDDEITTSSALDRARANHTGTQPSTSISDFTEAVQDAVAALLGGLGGVTLAYDDNANSLTISGVGVADPEVVRDVIGAAIIGGPLINISVNDASDTITITTTATANATDAALRDRSSHTGTQDVSTISGLSKSSVGLGNVDNTADSGKPISTAQQTALDLKATVAAVALKADTSALTAHTGDTANPHAVTKGQVGLGNADNTSDANKPISTATQTALDNKAPLNSGDMSVANSSTWGGATTISAMTVPETRTRTLTSNTTLTLPSNPASGASFTVTLIVKQAASGGPYTVTWPTLEWAGDAAAPIMPTTANAEMIVHLFWTGTAWRAMFAGYWYP